MKLTNGGAIMSKYSLEDKLRSISLVLDEGMSCKSSAKILGTDKSLVQVWVRKYEKYGEKGLTMKNRKYSGKFKIYVVEYMHKNHLSILETSLKFGVPDNTTVGRWKRIYLEEGACGLMKENLRIRKSKSTKIPSKQSYEELLLEVERLRIENEYLKKLRALIQERTNHKNEKKSK